MKDVMHIQGNPLYRQNVHIPGNKVPPNAHGKNIP